MMFGKLKINALVKMGNLANGQSISGIAADVFLNPPCVCQRGVDARINDFVHALRKAGVTTVRGTTTFDPIEVVKFEGWEFDCGGGVKRHEPLTKFCRGEGCPRADLCRRHMDAVRAENPTYFARSPIFVDGQCGEFVSNGMLRADPLRCGGAHPPPCCTWQCEIELHRWEQREGEWIYLAGTIH